MKIENWVKGMRIEDGVLYLGMPDDVYHKRPEINQSKLKYALTQPLKFKNPPPDRDSKAKIFGRAWHDWVTDEQLFFEKYICMPWKIVQGGLSASWTKSTKAQHPDKKILSAQEETDIDKMAEQWYKSEKVDSLLHGALREVSYFWTEVHNGISFRFKARIDILRRLNDSVIIIDIKTTLDGSPDAFRNEMAQRRYHFQLAAYKRGILAIEPGIKHVYGMLIACEKEPGYNVQPYEMPPRALQLGDRLVEKAIKTVADCTANDHWPGYTDDKILVLDLPWWEYKRSEE